MSSPPAPFRVPDDFARVVHDLFGAPTIAGTTRTWTPAAGGPTDTYTWGIYRDPVLIDGIPAADWMAAYHQRRLQHAARANSARHARRRKKGC
jgi:hypothetical protein